jgi:hypothetical protein
MIQLRDAANAVVSRDGPSPIPPGVPARASVRSRLRPFPSASRRAAQNPPLSKTSGEPECVVPTKTRPPLEMVRAHVKNEPPTDDALLRGKRAAPARTSRSGLPARHAVRTRGGVARFPVGRARGRGPHTVSSCWQLTTRYYGRWVWATGRVRGVGWRV